MISFFDGNCMYGNRQQVREGSVVSPEEYEELFVRAGISKVLTYHSLAVSSDMNSGNEAVARLQEENSRYCGQWVVMPSVTGEYDEPETLLRKMREAKIKSVRMFPKILNFSILPYSCKELYQMLEAHHIPLFLNENQIAYQELYQVMKAYPEMPLVLCGAGYRSERQIYPLAEICQNLYIETSSYVANHSIERFSRRFGADRLVFGSGVPDGSVCGAVFSVLYADISEQEKQMIAADNLKHLLEGSDL